MRFLDKLKQGLSKTKGAIFGQIDEVLKAFVKVDEDMLEELEELLIMSDVGVGATEEIIERLREDIKDGRLKEKEQVIDALKAILSDMIGEGGELDLSGQPTIILVIGVNGAGKTTSIGKISNRLISNGKKVVVAAADTFRAAAIDQLAVWCERSGADIVKQNEGSDPAAVVFDAVNYAKKRASTTTWRPSNAWRSSATSVSASSTCWWASTYSVRAWTSRRYLWWPSWMRTRRDSSAPRPPSSRPSAVPPVTPRVR